MIRAQGLRSVQGVDGTDAGDVVRATHTRTPTLGNPAAAGGVVGRSQMEARRFPSEGGLALVISNRPIQPRQPLVRFAGIEGRVEVRRGGNDRRAERDPSRQVVPRRRVLESLWPRAEGGLRSGGVSASRFRMHIAIGLDLKRKAAPQLPASQRFRHCTQDRRQMWRSGAVAQHRQDALAARAIERGLEVSNRFLERVQGCAVLTQGLAMGAVRLPYLRHHLLGVPIPVKG